MKIIFFNRSFYPDITATGQLLTELCEDLVKDYHCQVSVIAGRPLVLIDKNTPAPEQEKWRMVQEEDYKGIKILRVNNTAFSTKSFLGRIANYLSYFVLSFIASFGIDKPDIVVTLTDPPIICLMGYWISLRFNIPHIVSARDIFPEASRGLEGSQNKIINFLLDRIVRFCFKRARHVIALGKMMRARIIEKEVRPENVSIISDWADCENIKRALKINQFSLSQGISGNFVVMYAGNIGASSGLEFVIDTANLLKEYKDILFVFIGDGINKGRLIELSEKFGLQNIKFLPYQPRDMLSYVVAAADIFIVPLKKGLSGFSLPSKVYMVLASGKPYIASVDEEGEVAHITHEFNCGLIAKPEDPIDLKEKIIFLYQDEQLRLKMGENAAKASGVFDRRPGVRHYYELFQKINR